ncbi:MAG: MFS transporter, partial [Actinobacteria bacterium]|nr:MFS transporter [Actinomycetota bacterium]
DLVSANALLGGAQDLAIVVGPVVAAAVNLRWGLAGAFLADALTYLAGMAAAWPLRVESVAGGVRSTWVELREGLSLVRRTPGLRWTLGITGTTFLLWGLFGVLEPLYVRDVLQESETVFALLQTVFGVGLVGAGIALANIGERVARPRYVAIATIASGATAALYLGTSSLPVAYFGVFLWGVDVAFFFVPAKTLLQRYAPTSAHGRVLSLNQTLEPMAGLGMAPVAAVLVGAVGIQLLGVLGGLAAAVAGTVALRRVALLGPLPAPTPVDPTAGSTRDAIALGGPAPG